MRIVVFYHTKSHIRGFSIIITIIIIIIIAIAAPVTIAISFESGSKDPLD